MVVSLKSSGATMLLLHLFVAGPTLALKLPSVMPKVWGKGRTTTAASSSLPYMPPSTSPPEEDESVAPAAASTTATCGPP